jgi:hypothetical protein
MGSQNRIAAVVVLLAVALVVQVVMIAADCRQSPLRVATGFAKDYFYLDADMQKYLCEPLADDGELVDQYLYQKRLEASQRGVSTNYLRYMFTELHLKTLHQDDKSAQIHLEGTTRVAINPVFMVVGKWFFIGKNYPVEETLDLVKEEQGWRVCGHPFGMGLAQR